MRFAKWVFWVAGIYGIAVVLPLYLLENRMSRDFRPPITHPEFYYGFVGVALAWQVAFIVIALDPMRFRPMMIPAVIEKFSYAIACGVLFAQGRLAPAMTVAASVDLTLGLLFVVAFRVCSAKAAIPPA
jgi:hypothetical protein